MYLNQIVQSRNDLLRTRSQWQTPLVSTQRFDMAQANAYDIVNAIKGIQTDKNYIWIAHIPARSQMEPAADLGAVICSDGEDSDSEQEGGGVFGECTTAGPHE